MIASTFMLIFKIVAVIGLIAAMSMVLVGIRHFLSDPSEAEETDTLRKEVYNEDSVISSHSLFHQFLTAEERNHRNQRNRNPYN